MESKTSRPREKPVRRTGAPEDGVSLTGSRRDASEDRPLQRPSKEPPLETYERPVDNDGERPAPDSAVIQGTRTARDEP